MYSHVVREPNLCFASLVWYISRYGEETLILLSVSTGLIMFSTIIIFIRLSMATLIDKQQRIAASRIVYYNVLGLVSLVCFLINIRVGMLTYNRALLFHTLFHRRSRTGILSCR